MNAVDRLKKITQSASLKSRSAQREVAIANTVTDDTNLKRDFDFVTKHPEYDLVKTGEYELAKDIARQNKESAATCFASIAACLRRPSAAVGINERIKAMMEKL